MRTQALFILFLYWLAVNYLVLHTPFTIFPTPGLTAIAQVSYLAPATPVDSLEELQATAQQAWQAIELPDDWYKNHQDRQQIWYRTTLDIQNLNDPIWGVYLPAVTHNAAVYLNGHWVGQGGKFTDPVSRHHNEPLLFRFSSHLLKQGTNTIDIRVETSFYEQGFLEPLYIAPIQKLEGAYEWKKFVRVDFIEWITIAMYLMAAIILAFWIARPQDNIYGLFCLELFFWATHNLNLFIADIPTSAKFWEAMTMSTLGWTVVAMIFFNHRYVGHTNKTVEKIILVFAALGVGMFFLPDVESVLHIGYRVWDFFLIIFGSYAIYFLGKAYWQNQNTDVLLMLIAGIPILVFGFHDILVVNHFLSKHDGLIIQYSVIPAAILFSWFLVRRFVDSINHAEHLAETLELRVQQKQKQLQEQFEQLSQMQKQQFLAEERERIMRDMHDGIGGQLVSTITMLQEHSGEVFKNIREKLQLSLTDLRLMIDSFDPLLNDLPTLLGMMRMRLTDQLESAGITLEWAVTELPELDNMSPQRSLHIMRIIQEAITNSIKHAATDKILLATGISDDKQQIYINVTDYGKGMETATTDTPGRGIKNMQYRAQQIDADLNITSSTDGSTVQLAFNV